MNSELISNDAYTLFGAFFRRCFIIDLLFVSFLLVTRSAKDAREDDVIYC